MNKKVMRICAAAMAVICLLGATSVFAGWKLAGYDVCDNAVATGRYACIYHEYDANGIFTGAVKVGEEIYTIGLDSILPAYAQSVEWKVEFVDRTYTCLSDSSDKYFNHEQLGDHACGNLQYARLYLDGKAQPRVAATGAFAKIEYKWVDLWWDMAAPYKIYQKLYANLPGLGWYTDSSYPMQYSGVNENVKVESKQVYIVEADLPMVGDVTGYEALFNKGVRKLQQRKLTGTSIPVSVFDEIGELEIVDRAGLFTNGTLAEPKWIDAGHEAVYPFRKYQVLSLDGYLMDGTTIKIETNNTCECGEAICPNPKYVTIKKPYIYRYTGGYANGVWDNKYITNEVVPGRHVDEF